MDAPAHYVLVDTDVASYRYGNRPEFKQFEPFLKGRIPAISFVTLGEALGGALLAGWSPDKVAAYETYLESHYLLIPADRFLAEERARLYAECTRKGTTISQDDLWIAATAIRYNIPLLTNDRAFRHIPGLVVLPSEEQKAEGGGFKF